MFRLIGFRNNNLWPRIRFYLDKSTVIIVILQYGSFEYLSYANRIHLFRP